MATASTPPGLRAALILAVVVSPALAAAPPVPLSGAHAGLACDACHVSASPADDEARYVSCTGGDCHSTVADVMRRSRHDRQHLGDTAARCAECHGGHAMRPSDEIPAFACQSGLDQPCVECHDAAHYRVGPSSAGGAVHAAGDCASAAITCFTCHGYHGILPRTDPDSPVGRTNIAATCGTCHEQVRTAYADGAHGAALDAGNDRAPTCVSCHGGHGVVPVSFHDSPTSAARVVFTCAECHEDPGVLRGTELPLAAVEGYEETFHGIANAHGVHDVATCVSCHGAHAVLPASDPRSPVNTANLERTCGACHEQLTPEMLASVQHTGSGFEPTALLARLRVYFPVAGTSLNPLLISGMGALVGFLSGLFGVGGGFLMTPLLIFIGIPAAVAAATDAAQICAGATSGAISHSRLGNVDFKMGLVIVVGGWSGGFAGVQLVHVLRNLGNFDFFLKLVYVLILGFVGSTMFIEGLRTLRGRRSSDSGEPGPSRLTLLFSRLPFQTYFPKSGLKTSILLPVAAGFAVGVLAAFLGVGGGFIMLPTMIYIIGIPTRVAVGTDLFQIVLTSANVTLQQSIFNHTVDLLLAVTLFAGSVIGAQFGVLASRHLKGEQIRIFLALIVLVVMTMLLFQLLSTPDHLIDFAKSGGGH